MLSGIGSLNSLGHGDVDTLSRPVAKDGKFVTTVTYLEMTEDPRRQVMIPPRRGLKLRLLPQPSVSLYRRLFDIVGGPWLWWGRKVLNDEQLQEIIHDPLVEVHVLYLNEQPLGFGELDGRNEGQVELVYLGLMLDQIGQGIGRWLLGDILRQAWAKGPERVWLHTCNLDHPKAIAFYKRAGFTIFKEQTEVIDDPRVSSGDPFDNVFANGS